MDMHGIPNNANGEVVLEEISILLPKKDTVISLIIRPKQIPDNGSPLIVPMNS